MAIPKSTLRGIYLVPGLPQVLQCTDQNEGYQKLNEAMRWIGEDMNASGVERILYYSTQWLAVLDQMFQAKTDLKGTHVDENWYDYGKLDFDLRIDRRFAEKMGAAVQEVGQKVRLVDFDGFPVDTGTIVADTLINQKHIPSGVVANNVYTDYEKTRQLAQVIRRVIDQDGTPTAVVAVSGLSGRFFTTPIDLREDQLREPSDDTWNRTMLAHWENGQFDQAEAKIPLYAKEARVDMGFKAYAFMRGMDAEGFQEPAKVLGYSAIYGTGGAVIKFAGGAV